MQQLGGGITADQQGRRGPQGRRRRTVGAAAQQLVLVNRQGRGTLPVRVRRAAAPAGIRRGGVQNPYPTHPVLGPRTRKPTGRDSDLPPLPPGLKPMGFGSRPDPLSSLVLGGGFPSRGFAPPSSKSALNEKLALRPRSKKKSIYR